MVAWGFDGARGTDVRPPHVGAEHPWAKDATTGSSNDGTILTASVVNRLVGNIRALAVAYDVSLTESSDDDIKSCIVAAIQAVQPATHDHDGRYYTETEIDAIVATLVTTASIVDDVTSGGTTVPLSAEQGKILNERINGLGDVTVVADLTEAAALTGLDAGDIIHVLDNGSSTWVRYQVTAAGNGTWAGVTKVIYFTQDQAPASHGHPAADITDSTADGRLVLTAADFGAIRALLSVYTIAQVDALMAALVIPRAPEGRLTLESGVPAGTGTSATSVYYTPCGGNRVPIYDGTKWVNHTFSELVLALDATAEHTAYHAANSNFDLFVVNDGGTIRLVTGPAWTSGTGRGAGTGTTELDTLDGFLVNKQALTAARFGASSGNTILVPAQRATYVGTLGTISAGQCDDNPARRYLWNYYNRLLRTLRLLDSTDTWTYSTNAWRQARNAATNQVDILIGVASDPVEVTVSGMVQNSSSTVRYTGVAVGLDSTSPVSNSQLIASAGAGSGNSFGAPRATYCGYPGIGRHFLAWLELGAGAETQTWWGDNGMPAAVQSGIVGQMRG